LRNQGSIDSGWILSARQGRVHRDFKPTTSLSL
jgi:hypothetical protein